MTDSQQVTTIQKYFSIVFETIKGVKNISVLPFIQEIITFASIVLAYKYVSFTYDNDRTVQKWTNIQFDKEKTLSTLLLAFSVYIIILKIVLRFVTKYGVKTTPKQPLSQQNKLSQQQSVQQSSKEIKLVPSYTQIVAKLIQHSIFGLVFAILITAYAIKSPFNKSKPTLLKIQQINFLMFWFVAANIFYGFGNIFGKMFKVSTLHVFGLSIGIIVILIELGMAHGFNMFIFI